MESTAAFDGTEVANDAERRVGAGIFHYDVGDGFGETEVLHVLGDGDAQFVAEVEEVVDGIARVEYDGGVVEYLYLLLAELAGCDSLDFDKWMENQFDAMLLLNLEVRRLLRRRGWLRHQNFLNHLFLRNK